MSYLSTRQEMMDFPGHGLAAEKENKTNPPPKSSCQAGPARGVKLPGRGGRELPDLGRGETRHCCCNCRAGGCAFILYFCTTF